MTEVAFNHDFTEVESGARQVLVTNDLGRTIEHHELVYLDGWFGEVVELDGIADNATGYINVDWERKIRSNQVEATDTFTVGNTMYFVPGSGAAGTLTDAAGGTGVAIGTITDEGGTGGAQTWVEFMPFLQQVNTGDHETRITALEAVNTTAEDDPGLPFRKTVTLTAVAAATPIEIIAAAAGKTVYVTNFIAKVDGATSWATTGTVVNLQDDAGTPEVGAAIAVAALTGNAVIGPFTTNVTLSDPISKGDGFTADKGLNVAGDDDFGEGSDLVVTVVGFIADTPA